MRKQVQLFTCQYGGLSYVDEVIQNDDTDSVGNEESREGAEAIRLRGE